MIKKYFIGTCPDQIKHMIKSFARRSRTRTTTSTGCTTTTTGPTSMPARPPMAPAVSPDHIPCFFLMDVLNMSSKKLPKSFTMFEYQPTFRYHADHYTGYVAEVTYEGVAHFPEHHPHPGYGHGGHGP